MTQAPDDKDTGNPVFMLRPDGSLKDISEKASLLRTFTDSYKMDSELFVEALDKAILELRKELEEDIDGSETD